MKLIYCRACGDIFNLGRDTKHCTCGESGGFYGNDGLHATYWGANAMMLGIQNISFVDAVNRQLRHGDLKEQMMADGVTVKGRSFEAFVIPDGAPTVMKAAEVPNGKA